MSSVTTKKTHGKDKQGKTGFDWPKAKSAENDI